MQRAAAPALMIALAVVISAVVAGADDLVAAHARETKLQAAKYECKAGHKIEKRYVTLDSGAVRYALQYSGCVDPSHEGTHPSAEGNFGMPQPISGNWYWGGFMRILINGKDATLYTVTDWRVIDTGKRGTFQVVFAHPDADVALRFMMLPGGNHLLTDLRWLPHEDARIDTVSVDLRCYPSFFTSARHRVGDRHVRTPRIDTPQGQTLQILPGEDAWLYYYDTVFDTAKGEGDGPCAAVIPPQGLQGGRVSVGGYAVSTTLDYDPEAGEARIGLYDFTGLTNADAGTYLDENGARDLEELVTADFRPSVVQTLDADALRAQAMQLLADAGEDGVRFAQRVETLLDKVDGLEAAARAGDIAAEADLGAEIQASADLFWKLKTFAVLNSPGD